MLGGRIALDQRVLSGIYSLSTGLNHRRFHCVILHGPGVKDTADSRAQVPYASWRISEEQ